MEAVVDGVSHADHTVYQFKIANALEALAGFVFSPTKKIESLGIFQFEFILLMILLALGVYNLIRMILYHNLYQEIIDYLKGDYHTALENNDKQNAVENHTLITIFNSVNRNNDLPAEGKGLIRDAAERKKELDKSKIPFEEAVKSLPAASRSEFLVFIVSLFTTGIFFLRGIGIVGRLMNFISHKSILVIPFLFAHAAIHIIIFVLLLLVLIDRSGLFISTTINSVINMITFSLFTFLNITVTESTRFVCQVFTTPIVKNYLFALAGMFMHSGVGALISLTAGGDFSAIYGQLMLNLLAFMLFNVAYFIIYEYDIVLVLYLLYQNLPGLKRLNKHLNIFVLIAARTWILFLTVFLCYLNFKLL
ncbi:hypothetical protein NEOKW01_1979 [Nematocida sp. AWRm80]|nr:hypothetical protein NEOKW01_1979 [Nematocida sp. AWRm80]